VFISLYDPDIKSFTKVLKSSFLAELEEIIVQKKVGEEMRRLMER
jgi:hypothetical protein